MGRTEIKSSLSLTQVNTHNYEYQLLCWNKKERILQAFREKQHIAYREHWFLNDLYILINNKIIEFTKQGKHMFKLMREKLSPYQVLHF